MLRSFSASPYLNFVSNWVVSGHFIVRVLWKNSPNLQPCFAPVFIPGIPLDIREDQTSEFKIRCHHYWSRSQRIGDCGLFGWCWTKSPRLGTPRTGWWLRRDGRTLARV